MDSMVKHRTKPFFKTFFTTFFGIDIPDENSGLDTYINSKDQSAEALENAEIAQQLKKSLADIDAKNNNIEKRTSTRTSIKSKATTIEPKTTSKNNIMETRTIKPQKDDKEIY